MRYSIAADITNIATVTPESNSFSALLSLAVIIITIITELNWTNNKQKRRSLTLQQVDLSTRL